MYKFILFDFDGTVFDTVEGITRSVRYAANKLGLDAETEALRCFAGPPLTDMFQSFFGLPRETAELAVSFFRERYLPIGLYECRVFPGIKQLLEQLRACGFRLGIATSKPQPLAEKLLSGEDMTALFDVISGSGVSGNDDSKAAVLRTAMESMGAVPEQTILVGDTKYDVEGARACGIDCIGVSYGYAAEGELEAAGAKYIAADIAELAHLLIPESD